MSAGQVAGGLAAAAATALTETDPLAKCRMTRRLAAAWRDGTLSAGDRATAPDRPGRPEKPELVPPGKVPRRKIGQAPESRIALLHALAHIELNAVDLSLDILIRFPDTVMPDGFRGDWISVADDEARHFTLLSDRLGELGSHYGALPAHDGLWQSALDTADDLLPRLAIVPLVLEARGLDVTPPMIQRMRAVGDDPSADILQTIHDDEIGHVAVGKRWFDHLCRERDLPPVETYHHLVRTRFRGQIKRPFNHESRARAGFHAAFYEPLAVD